METEPKWEEVEHFGNGIIYRRGDERKIVTPNMSDFEYKFEDKLKEERNL